MLTNISNPDKIKKILCIKPRGIGDILLSTIILKDLSTAFPNAEIHYLTERFAADSLKYHPLVKKVLTMGKKEFPLKVAFRLWKEKYDLILDLWSNPRSAQITFLSFVKYRVGYAYRGRKYAYNIFASGERVSNLHSAEDNLKFLDALNIPIKHKDVLYYTSNIEDNFANEFYRNNFSNYTNVIGIVPSGGWESKRCDKEKWVEICQALVEKYNCGFLILWGPGDEEDSNYIKDNLGERVVLAPKTSLNEMAALIKKCFLVIANDSGPMHISAALRVPTLGIFGPTNPKAHGPYSPKSAYVLKEDLFCIVCNKLECPYNHECMKELKIEKVIKKIDDLVT